MTSGRSAKWAGIAACLALGLCGCTPPGIVRLSNDTYRVSRADPGHVYADAAALKAAAAADADAFARGRGQRAVEVDSRLETLSVGHLTTLDYDFRLVADEATAAVAAAVPPSPTAAPGGSGVAAPPPPPAAAPAHVPPSPPPDLSQYRVPDARAYDELLRLDELRKRGILTEEEFQTLKAKILVGR
jgi:hypothetical protein